jgi:hypothetical protein
VSTHFYDPLTGDELTRLEYFVRQTQVLVRTPLFILLFLVVTSAVWLTGNSQALVWWNLSASALAIVVEWLVGTYMFGQTGRDATYIRKIAHLEEKVERMDETHGQQLQQILDQLKPPTS